LPLPIPIADGKVYVVVASEGTVTAYVLSASAAVIVKAGEETTMSLLTVVARVSKVVLMEALYSCHPTPPLAMIMVVPIVVIAPTFPAWGIVALVVPGVALFMLKVYAPT
jgi:hypothetical protein